MIPFLYKSEYVMKLWLGDVPEYAPDFARCVIFSSLLWASVAPFYDAVYAANKVNKFLIIPELVFLIVLPSTYIACKVFHDPVMMMSIIVLFDIFVVLIRIYYSVKGANLDFKDVINIVAIPSVLVGALAFLSGYLLNMFLSEESFLNFILLIILNAFALLIIIYVIGLKKHERDFVTNICYVYLKKLIRTE